MQFSFFNIRKRIMSNGEKLKYIIENELIITLAINKGHKASNNDQFSEIRKKIKQFRIELKLIKK